MTIVEATFQLKKSDPVKIKEKMDHLTFLRESKQPLEYPSCGSVFKRPPIILLVSSSGSAELQGTRVGGAEISINMQVLSSMLIMQHPRIICNSFDTFRKV